MSYRKNGLPKNGTAQGAAQGGFCAVTVDGQWPVPVYQLPLQAASVELTIAHVGLAVATTRLATARLGHC